MYASNIIRLTLESIYCRRVQNVENKLKAQSHSWGDEGIDIIMARGNDIINIHALLMTATKTCEWALRRPLCKIFQCCLCFGDR